MNTRQLVIVGGGPAGLSAAISAFDEGIKDILVIDREPKLGGVINQCIHNGFGTGIFDEELTGPEYAKRFADGVTSRGIEYTLDSTALNVDENKVVTYVNGEGVHKVKAQAVLLACGCRERPRGGVNMAGSRAAGVFSAGTAQKLLNVDGCLPGKEAVILGSGDIGLMLARRMTVEGAKVKAVVEIMPKSHGLPRNIVQCLQDFDIPLVCSHTVVDIKAQNGRVSAVVIAKVDENLSPILSTAQEITCDTLILSVGLLPESDLAKKAGAAFSDENLVITDENFMTSVKCVFVCGNMLHIHEYADDVSLEAALAGKKAALFIQNKDMGTENWQKSAVNHTAAEIASPMRTLTSTVRVSGGEIAVASVKTLTPVRKERLAECIAALKDVQLTAPVHAGDVVIENVCGTGADVVATKDVNVK